MSGWIGNGDLVTVQRLCDQDTTLTRIVVSVSAKAGGFMNNESVATVSTQQLFYQMHTTDSQRFASLVCRDNNNKEDLSSALSPERGLKALYNH